jgi:subtilisin-like proprotein convertase family protein
MRGELGSRRFTNVPWLISIGLALVVVGPAASVQQDGPATIGSATATYSSGPLGLSIADHSTTTHTINASGAVGVVSDVNVHLRINHTSAADLRIVLTSPSGVPVALTLNTGGDLNNFGSGAADCTGTFTALDDEASTRLEVAQPPFVGVFKPDRPLSGLDGASAAGAWRLTVEDTATSNTGTLFCWQIALTRSVAPANYEGDVRTDFALVRPSGSSLWLHRTLQSSTVALNPFGMSGDIPIPAVIFAGTHLNTRTIYRPSTGLWGSPGVIPVTWGLPDDVPVPGDYNADGLTDIAVWRPSTGVWFVRSVLTMAWGVSGDVPVPADYRGGPATDLAVWRPSNGAWFIAGIDPIVWGVAGDICVPADYVGDEKADIAVFRPTTGAWYIRGPQGELQSTQFGTYGDIPVPADYDGDGKDDIGVFRPSEGRWYIRNIGVIEFGMDGDIPVVKRPTHPGYPY